MAGGRQPREGRTPTGEIAATGGSAHRDAGPAPAGAPARADELAHGDGAVEVLAYNEWPGLRAPPALLATFVTPNHPVVAGVLRRVRDRLRALTGDDALDGYQSRSPERVRAMARALYATIQELGISYASAPASYERGGQKIRLPDAVLGEQMGNCLDVAVLFASCLEQMGLAPLLVLLEGHAFAGLWLCDERFPEGVVFDAARLRTCLALGQLAFVDSSTTVLARRPPFDEATTSAEVELADDERFACALDVRVVRGDRFRPLPFRDAPAATSPAQPSAPASRGMARTILEEAARPSADGIAGARQTPPPPPAPPTVVARFRTWRDQLLDLTLRNKLLAFRPDAGRALPLDVPDLGRFEDALASGRALELLPRPATDPAALRREELVRARADADALRASRLADLERGIVHCPQREAEMLARAVKLDREARTAFEEGGAHTLYAAVGLLRWFETDASELPRLAPLVLVPVALDYKRSTRRVRLRRVDDDSLVNVTLIEKLRRDHAIDLGGLSTLEPDEQGLDVAAALRVARSAIQRMPRWEVLEEAHLGLFTFTKFLMWRDLEDNADVLLENELVRHIAHDEKSELANPAPPVAPQELDDDPAVGRLPLVLDADSTQTAAIVAALAGRTFVLQGPPGTGKSQTIANLVAAALGAGKSVLFVSEKMAALEVVQRRLEQVGLGDFCLELHSHKASKRAVVAALGRSLQREPRGPAPAFEARARELAERRARLDGYARSLHAPRPLGTSFFQASARVLELEGAPRVELALGDARGLDESRLRAMREASARFGVAAGGVEPVAQHPFRGCAPEAWSAGLEERARQALGDAPRALGALDRAAQEVAAGLGLPTANRLGSIVELASIDEAVAAGPLPARVLDDDAWSALSARATRHAAAAGEDARRRAELARRWSGALFELDVVPLERRFAAWATAFVLFAWLVLFFPRRRLRRAALGKLPDNRQIASDLATARTTLDAAPGLDAAERGLRDDGGGAWTGPASELPALLARGEALRTALRRYLRMHPGSHDDLRAALAAESPLRESAARAARPLSDTLAAWRGAQRTLDATLGTTSEAWPRDEAGALAAWQDQLLALAAGMRRFRPWCLYQAATADLVTLELGPVAEEHRRGRLRASDAEDASERAVLSAWVSATRDHDGALRGFDGPNHHRLVAEFQEADRALLALGAEHVVRTLEERLPRGGSDVAATSEPGILRRELAKKTRLLPIRKLLQEIPNLLPRVAPCLLMSPLSVAQYLPASGRRFDLVVFDEASQICTHDAIGAIARGHQAVVVGDSRQLPPTSFFQRGAAEDEPVDENDFDEVESILDEAKVAGVPEQMLGWHYRSRHEALIDFSNRHYYDGRLHVFPAARGRAADLGVHLHSVPHGHYDAGHSRTNRGEAEALVAHLVAALETTEPGARSFGVVTFSQAQQSLVADLLDEARGRTPALDAHFGGGVPEPVFVKNLENVQGDERDEILFSIGYAPDARGRLLMNFGPLNRAGGERRLNVAVTRARAALRVFSTLRWAEIDPARTAAVGAAHLRAFLRYVAERDAAAGELSPATASFGSEIERQIHAALVAGGHRVHTQVGCGGYRVDLAIVDPRAPESYLLGVECDGAAYASGATARDRDRLRQQVLEGLGWRLHRVWSSDWWFDRARETERLAQAIAGLLREPGPPGPIVGSDTANAPAPGPPGPIVGSDTADAPAPGPPGPIVGSDTADAPAPGPPGPIVGSDASPIVPYRRAALAPTGRQPDDLHAPAHATLVQRQIAAVVDVEAPVHLDELARRVGACFGVGRLGTRLRRRVAELVGVLDAATVRGDFVWRREDDPGCWQAVRTPAAGEEPRDAELLPPEEIAAAVAWVLRGSLALPEVDLSRETARLFGIQRLGARVSERMTTGIELAVARGQALREGERIVWREPP